MRQVFMTTGMVLLFFLFQMGLAGIHASLYLPREIQQALEKKTRTLSGKPGEAYWQNRADYSISVKLVTETGKIEGEETVVYRNNSPDSLRKLVFRLYPNLYKKGNPRQFPLPEEDLTEGMSIDFLKIGEETFAVNEEKKKVRHTPTNLVVYLVQPIPPGANCCIEFRWHFTLPRKRPVRMGQYGNSEFFVAYWYPQVAVYDDVNGWDMREYTGTTEFYNDFNNYDVRITLPGDYVVWATGKLQNAEEVLRAEVVRRYRQALVSDTVVHIITPQDYREGRPTLPGSQHTWHFVAKNVSDFSFATSNHYNWDGVSLVVDTRTGRRVLTDVAYPDSATHYEEAALFARATVEYLSFQLPGVPFPYPHITTFCNGTRRGGMETPMMTNVGVPRERYRTIGLIFHEIAHTYFPFYMGINERKYAWMDEGWASFFPREVVERLEPDHDYLKGQIRAYVASAGKEWEVPMAILSYIINSPAYRMASYNRSSVAYYLLLDYLRRERFRQALQEYIHRWHGKHPLPIDFFFTFNEIAGEDLSWFWKPWFFEMGYPDLALTRVVQQGETCEIHVRREGNLPVPIKLFIVYQDSTTLEVYRPMSLWKSGQKELVIREKVEKPLHSVCLETQYIPDVNEKNNCLIVTQKNGR